MNPTQGVIEFISQKELERYGQGGIHFLFSILFASLNSHPHEKGRETGEKEKKKSSFSSTFAQFSPLIHPDFLLPSLFHPWQRLALKAVKGLVNQKKVVQWGIIGYLKCRKTVILFSNIPMFMHPFDADQNQTLIKAPGGVGVGDAYKGWTHPILLPPAQPFDQCWFIHWSCVDAKLCLQILQAIWDKFLFLFFFFYL